MKGYKFKKINIFKEYVETLYNLRLSYPKSDPMNLIAKLLMNSLYGKFGMKSESNTIDVFDSRNSSNVKILKSIFAKSGESIQDSIKVGHYYIISSVKQHYQISDKDNMYHGLEVNVAIAASVTANARCSSKNL